MNALLRSKQAKEQKTQSDGKEKDVSPSRKKRYSFGQSLSKEERE